MAGLSCFAGVSTGFVGATATDRSSGCFAIASLKLGCTLVAGSAGLGSIFGGAGNRLIGFLFNIRREFLTQAIVDY